MYSCDKCCKTFINNYTLHRHMKKVHHISIGHLKRGRKSCLTVADSFVCSEKQCQATYSSRNALYRHQRLKNHGQVRVKPIMENIEKFQFNSFADFSQWKEYMENTTASKFVRPRKDTKSGNSTRRTYVCHRSGYYRPTGRGVKRTKVQGSCKIGARCPACIYIRILPSGTIDVSFMPNHEGHECDTTRQQWTRDLIGINNRHKKGVKSAASLVTVIEENLKFAVADKNSSYVYTVQQNAAVPHSTPICPLRCDSCGICVHTFVCNCVDAGRQSTICKHIHLVVSVCQPVISCKTAAASTEADDASYDAVCNVFEPASSNASPDVSHIDLSMVAKKDVPSTPSDETEQIVEQFKTSTASDQSNVVDKYVAHAEQMCSVILAKMRQSCAMAKSVDAQLTSVAAYINAAEQNNKCCTPVKQSQPAGVKKPSQQYRLSSTRKLRSLMPKPDASVSEPNVAEKLNILETLGVGGYVIKIV